MLKIPIDLYNDILRLLKLKHYSTLYEHLDYVGRKVICQYIINNALENETSISSAEQVEALLQILNPFICDPTDKPSDYEQDNEDYVEEQTLVARLFHLMQTDDLDEMFHILNTTRKLLANSGKDRIKYTFPPIVFKSYKLAYSYKEAAASDDKWDKKCDRIFKFCFQTINALLKAELPADIPFKLFLQGSIVIAEIAYENSENITYEFISQVIEFFFISLLGFS